MKKDKTTPNHDRRGNLNGFNSLGIRYRNIENQTTIIV
jgi:hypothetical protein